MRYSAFLCASRCRHSVTRDYFEKDARPLPCSSVFLRRDKGSRVSHSRRPLGLKAVTLRPPCDGEPRCAHFGAHSAPILQRFYFPFNAIFIVVIIIIIVSCHRCLLPESSTERPEIKFRRNYTARSLRVRITALSFDCGNQQL